jgi:hypothetical protein
MKWIALEVKGERGEREKRVVLVLVLDHQALTGMVVCLRLATSLVLDLRAE